MIIMGDYMKYALITGAANGLGLATTKHLVEKGVIVFACDIDSEGLSKLKSDKIYPIIMDITSEDSITKSFNYVKGITEKIDYILNFAGIIYMDSLIEGDLKIVEKVLNINVMGMVRINKIFFPLINNSKGRIINISSENGYLAATPFNGAYCMSKYAVEAYNDSLRRELNFLGITVINMQLGSFKTNMHNDTKSSFEALVAKSILYKGPLSKMGKMIEREIENANDISFLLEAVDEALFNKHPKHCYRVKNSPTMRTINLFSEEVIDKIYLKSLSDKKSKKS